MTITSAATSINHVPRLFKRYHSMLGSSNLDFGGGKYDTTNEFLWDLGITNYIIDPYNRSMEYNVTSIQASGIRSITCCNVLNVIDSTGDLHDCIRSLKILSEARNNAPIFISIYEGDRSNSSTYKRTGCCQRNQTMPNYMPVIQAHFTTNSNWKITKIDRTTIKIHK